VFKSSFVHAFYFADGDKHVREEWSLQDYIISVIEVSQAQSDSWQYDKRRNGLAFSKFFLECGSVRGGLCVVVVFLCCFFCGFACYSAGEFVADMCSALSKLTCHYS
jgi:hypothetical protein